MRVSIVSDAWFPQVNGVVTTLDTVGKELVQMGHRFFRCRPRNASKPFRVRHIPRSGWPSEPAGDWNYPGLGASVCDSHCDGRSIGSCRPALLFRRRLPFTTSFHTRFPEYLHARTRIPVGFTYCAVRWFHAAARRTMVATQTLREELSLRGFRQWFPGIAEWTPIDSSRGIRVPPFADRFTCMSGVWRWRRTLGFSRSQARRYQNLSWAMVPNWIHWRRSYPDAQFTRAKFGGRAGTIFCRQRCLCFPSRTDTFGLVILEALASGIPVAAYPVTGPKDVIGKSRAGVLSEDLGQAAIQCLKISPLICREYALQFSWKACAEAFVHHLEPTDTGNAIAESSPFRASCVSPSGFEKSCGDDSNPQPGRSAVRRASSSKRFAQARGGPAALNKRPAGSTRSVEGAGRTNRPRETVRL